jgi:hypothetical protein
VLKDARKCKKIHSYRGGFFVLKCQFSFHSAN